MHLRDTFISRNVGFDLGDQLVIFRPVRSCFVIGCGFKCHAFRSRIQRRLIQSGLCCSGSRFAFCRSSTFCCGCHFRHRLGNCALCCGCRFGHRLGNCALCCGCRFGRRLGNCALCCGYRFGRCLGNCTLCCGCRFGRCALCCGCCLGNCALCCGCRFGRCALCCSCCALRCRCSRRSSVRSVRAGCQHGSHACDRQRV